MKRGELKSQVVEISYSLPYSVPFVYKELRNRPELSWKVRNTKNFHVVANENVKD